MIIQAHITGTNGKTTTSDLVQRILRFRDLRKSFGGRVVLDGVSAEVRPGEVILLRGQNGSGKTTLLNILTGCLEPDSGTITYLSPAPPVRIVSAGESDKVADLPSTIHHPRSTIFSFPRPWHRDINPFQRFTPEAVARLGVGRTWQDIRLFKSLDLADNIAAASPGCGDSPWSALFRPRRTRARTATQRRAASVRLASLGLTGRDTSSADRVSLGQSKRVAIARALQADARILFLDEPLAGLDADGIHDVLTHLRALAADHGLTLVIIEHVLNIPRLLDFVSTVWTLENGHLTVATPDEVRQQTADTASITDIHALIRQALNREVPVTALDLPQGARLTTYWLHDQASSSAATPVLEIENLILQRGPRRLFADSTGQGLNLRLQPGTLNILEAPNGWGKTSLFDHLHGLLAEKPLQIRFDGKFMTIDSPRAMFQLNTRYLPSDTRMFPAITTSEVLNLSGIANPSPTHTFVDTLSGGERKMLAIQTIPNPPRVLLLDEPFGSEDTNAAHKTAIRFCSIQQRDAVLIANPRSQPS